MLYPPRRGTTILVTRPRAVAMKPTDSTRAEAAAFWKMKEASGVLVSKLHVPMDCKTIRRYWAL